jgi:hypothetical protein
VSAAPSPCSAERDRPPSLTALLGLVSPLPTAAEVPTVLSLPLLTCRRQRATRTPFLRPKSRAMLVAPPLQHVQLHHAHSHRRRSTGMAAPKHTHTHTPSSGSVPRRLWGTLCNAARRLSGRWTRQCHHTANSQPQVGRVCVDCRYIERIQSCAGSLTTAKGAAQSPACADK